MSHKYSNFEVELPDHDADVTIKFPGGATMEIQARPSNADDNYEGSLDVILPNNDYIVAFVGDDMQASPRPREDLPNTIYAKQLWTELPSYTKAKEGK